MEAMPQAKTPTHATRALSEESRDAIALSEDGYFEALKLLLWIENCQSKNPLLDEASSALEVTAQTAARLIRCGRRPIVNARIGRT